MKKKSLGFLLMSILLVLTSVPVSAADITGQEADEESLQDDQPPAGEEQQTEQGETDSPIEDDGDDSDVDVQGELFDVQETQSYTHYDLKSEYIKVRIKNDQTEYTYTGAEIQPEVEVIYHDADADKDTVLDMGNYDVGYENNVNAGTAKIILTGKDGEESSEGSSEEASKDTYTGKKEVEFSIIPADIASCEMQAPKVAGYTGKQVKPEVILTYHGQSLVTGKDYKVTYSNNKNMGTATLTVTGIGNFRGTRSASFTIKIAAPSVKISSNYSRIRLTWGKVKKASGYQVYRSTSPTSGFKKIKTYTSGSKKSYTDTKAKFNKTYYYKVRSYQKVKVKVKGKTKTKKVYSPWSAVVSSKRKLSKTAIKSAQCVTGSSAKVSWKKTTGAQGYEIYKCETKNGAYTYAGKIKGGSRTSYTVKKLQAGVKYYFKVRAYRKSGSKICYGAFSTIKKETVSEGKRLAFLFPYGVPTTKAQMEKYLVTITVPIKDVNGVPSTLQLRVHKSLAKEFTGAFLDMYAIGFPVRAEDTDTYNWRSMASGKSRSHHSYGCVVDLNWDSNPMIGVTDGKYRPGVDPYSVTPEVVAIWKKHGFYWGGNWKSSKDYMHFTYTNH